MDYILVKNRFRNNAKDVQTLPGADIDSDHNLLVAKICTRLKKRENRNGIWRNYILKNKYGRIL
jgi:hypothetical protein